MSGRLKLKQLGKQLREGATNQVRAALRAQLEAGRKLHAEMVKRRPALLEVPQIKKAGDKARDALDRAGLKPVRPPSTNQELEELVERIAAAGGAVGYDGMHYKKPKPLDDPTIAARGRPARRWGGAGLHTGERGDVPRAPLLWRLPCRLSVSGWRRGEGANTARPVGEPVESGDDGSTESPRGRVRARSRFGDPAPREWPLGSARTIPHA